MLNFRELLEIVIPAAVFVAAIIVISNGYRQKLRSAGRKYRKGA